MSSERQNSWAPYLAGAGIGALSWFAVATAKRPLGISTAFEHTAALLAKDIAPGVTGVNSYVQAIEEAPKLGWESALLLGVGLGSALGTLGAKRQSTDRVPPMWKRRFGPSVTKRYTGAVLGGAMVMFGARMAKGCTSGHGISGIMQLALSSWVFTPIIFVSGALTARALFGKGGQ